jgi:L-fuconolactonase
MDKSSSETQRNSHRSVPEGGLGSFPTGASGLGGDSGIRYESKKPVSIIAPQGARRQRALQAIDSALKGYNVCVHRRTFLGVAAAGVSTNSAASADKSEIPIIDTHIHLFDPARPQGIPWPAKDNRVLYRAALPARYRKLAVPLGIRGAIEVECSPWVEDNQWVLDVAAKDTILVGTVGNLEPGKPDFAKQLERFHRNPLFRGIRYGDLWGRNFAVESARPEFVADLKLLAGAGLVLDTANPSDELLRTVLHISDRVPELRMVIDHLPQATLADDRDVRELGKRPRIYVKLSEVVRRVAGRVPLELEFYRERLDQLTGIFGEDRVLYGSDWPNSDQWAPYDKVFGLVHEYFAGKSRAAAEKYFWKNSIAAYRWVTRK